MKVLRAAGVLTLVLLAILALAGGPAAAQQKPNIVVIMGDDIGIWNIGAYHRGMMAGQTPNLDKLAAEGCCSPTITPRRAVQRVAPTSSPGNCRSAPA